MIRNFVVCDTYNVGCGKQIMEAHMILLEICKRKHWYEPWSR